MQSITQDLRFALRQLRKSPGFTVLAALTLAIGIGSATAVFSLVDTVLLRPLPFPQPERLVSLDTLVHRNGGAAVPSDTSYPDFFDWRQQAKSFESMASYQYSGFTLSDSSGPARRITGLTVSADYFRVLGVAPSLGRNFTHAEEQAGNRSVILSQDLWISAFNSNPAVLGKSVRLNDETYFVVGVAPAGLEAPGTSDVALWVTTATTMEGKDPSGKARGWNQVNVLARLAPGVSQQQARDEMNRIQHAIAVQYPDADTASDAVSVRPELEALIGDVQRPLHILFAAVGMLLLIACANVAGLLLTRTAGRRPEFAVRTALGASRAQIVRQLMLEALALSVLGGVPGIALAALALRLAPRYLPPALPRAAALSLDGHVLLFTIATSLLTGLLFGVLPAWRMSRLDPASALRDQTRGNTANRSQQRLHSALIVGETAIGLVLLVGAGLLIRSFNKILSVDPGFDPHHVLTFRVGVPPKHFAAPQRVQFAQQLQTRLQALPGVKQASYGTPMPLTGGDINITFSIDGRPTSPGDEPAARASLVAANFFATMKMPLLRGRFFTSVEDRPHSAPTIIVNQAFANRYFPGEDALGKRIRSDIFDSDIYSAAPWREIVGIVANVSRTTLTEQAEPEFYMPFAQAAFGSPTFALRVTGDPTAYIDTVRAVVAEQDPSLSVYATKTYAELLATNTAQQGFQTLLLTAFAGIALLLAAVGLYGVLSYMVTQRTAELGVRMALGAQRSNILRLVLGRGLVLAVTGLAAGVAASLLLTRYLTSLLFATKALDIVTFVTMTLLLLTVSTVSCLVPAYRASRLDPNDTLRQQ